MVNFENCSIEKCIIHKVGNKLNDEKLVLSKKQLAVTPEIEKTLHNYFLKHFKSNTECNAFHHEIELNLNEVFTCVQKIFGEESFTTNAANIARHLYEQSRHASIKSGELFVVLFEEMVFDGALCNAVGLFKSERKEEYMQLRDNDREIELAIETGINPGKLDKGCIVFNDGGAEGYRVITYEQNSAETDYWRKEFLGIRPRNDNYHQTKNYLQACKEFIQDKLPDEFELTKADQIDYLSKSVEYFKKNEDFKAKEFVEEVFEDPDIIKSFKKFRNDYQEEAAEPLEDNFEISRNAVKKQAKVFKSILKLDKNFHIYIHGDRNLIEQGVDKDGRKFYKIYFEKEQ